MSSTNKKQAAETIKQAFKDWRDLYGRMANESRTELIKTLPPEAMIPKAGPIYGDKAVEAFKAQTVEYRQRARAALTDLRDEVKRQKTAAPSEEALRAVQAFQLRDPKLMTSEAYAAEAQDLVDAFGSNYLINQAIHDLAHKAGVTVNSHPLASAADSLDLAEQTINSGFDAFEAIRREGVTDGASSMFDYYIDSALAD